MIIKFRAVGAAAEPATSEPTALTPERETYYSASIMKFSGGFGF